MTDDRPDLELARYGECTLDEEGCSTCRDAAVPARVLRVDDDIIAVEDRVGRRAAVAADFLPGVRAGDIVLVHMGVAIGCVQSRVEEPS